MKVIAYKHPPFVQETTEGFTIHCHPWQHETDMQELWDCCSPEEADYIITPFIFSTSTASPFAPQTAMRLFTERLIYFERYPGKHIILDNSDTDFSYPFLSGATLFKTSASIRDPHVFALPYNTADPPELLPIAGARYDICFQGSLDTHPIRKEMARWMHSWKALKILFRETAKPFWSLRADEQLHFSNSYKEQLIQSVFVLCPRGRALNSRRFFEALSYGRIPVLITDAAKLPLASIIDYDKFVVTVPEGYGRWVPEFIADFKKRNDIVEASRLARRAFDHFFAAKQFRNFITHALERATM
jgi:hypothetical protein